MSDLFTMLEPVIKSGVETSKIELKREVDLKDRPKAAKFAKIVSALANTPGGTAYVVIGVKDRKDRQSNDPREYVVGFEVDQADSFQRQMQQALANYLEPVPEAKLLLVDHPVAGKTMGVIQISRSFNRPHAVKRSSENVEQGVYLKRSGELHPANTDEIRAMETASQSNSLVLNFVRALTPAQIDQLRCLLGALPEVIDLPGAPVQFPAERLLDESVTDVLDSAGLTLDQWTSLSIIVNLPGLAPAASAIIAEIHGRTGHFPHVIRLTPSPEDSSVYIVSEVVKLQNIRDAARHRATRTP